MHRNSAINRTINSLNITFQKYPKLFRDIKLAEKTLITFLTIENNNLKTHSDSSIKSDMGQHLFAILALFHYKCRWKHYPHYRHIIGRWKHIILPSAELSTDSATTPPPSGPTSTLTPSMQSLRGFLNKF